MNILDLSPEDFESSLKELGLGAEREQFLRDEYAKKNSISGQTLEAFQEVTAVPEGRERAMVAPMTKPEGMSGLEAIRSGEAELAVPGFLTGAVEGVGQALTTGEKVTQGIGVTEEELQQAAETSASLGMANIPRAMARGYDPRVVSIFGGYNAAKNPGKNIRGEPLPVSRGVDTLYRFEIDDSASSVSNLDTLTPVSSWKNIPDKTTKLSDALDHEELFYQYPELKDVKFVIDESASSNALGWAMPDGSAIAISKAVSENPKLAREVIIHEVSHLVQQKENFALGTNVPAEGDNFHEVRYISQADINSPENKQQWDDWQQALKETQKIENIETPIKAAEVFGAWIARSRGLTLEQLKNLQEPSTWEKIKSFFKPLPQEDKAELLEISSTLRSLDTLAEMAKKNDVSFSWARGWINSAYKSLSVRAERLGEGDLFTQVLGATPKDFREYPAYELFFPEPELPKVPAPNSSYNRDYLHNVYERKAGEAEARNAANRLNMTLDERFQVEPQFTEDVARSLQWITPYNYVPPAELFKQNYAEGGMVEDNQMRKLFQEGGMTDDGMQVEPVTGNEIPAGSLASEVRDDIPAQLSEGEYIVPADVVRFFGVKFFEDLRMQAKQGLTEMDKEGRIGGAPVDENGIPMEDDEALSPEEEQMLREALGVTGMAEGGFATRDPAFGSQEFDRSQFTLSGTSAGGIESRKYIDPTTGKTVMVQFMNGTPLGAIPVGYVPWTKELEDQAKAVQKEDKPVALTPVKTESGSDRRDNQPTGGTGGGTKSYDNWAKENFDALTKDPYQFGIDALTDESGQTAGTILKGVGLLANAPLAMVAGGVSNAFNRAQNIAEAKTALLEMEYQGLSDSQEYANLQKLVDAQVSNLPKAQQLAINQEWAATGKNYFDATNRLRGTTTPTTTRSTTTGTPAATSAPTTKPQPSSGGAGSSRDSSDRLSFSNTTTGGKSASSAVTSTGAGSTPKQFSSSTTGGKSASTTSNKASDYSLGSTTAPSTGKTTSDGYSLGTPAGNTGVKKESVEQKLQRGGGFQKGGLVTRPKKKTKKLNKGLAS